MATDPIQQYLDENNCLIYAIIQAQNDGKLEDSARNLEKLQQNLTYLAAIADNQPLQFPITAQQHQQHSPNILIHSVSQCPQPQQAQFYTANVPVPQALQLIQQQQTQQSLPNAVLQPGSQIIHTQEALQMNPQILMLAQPVILYDQIHQHHLAQALLVQDQMPQHQFPHYPLVHGPQSQLAQPVVMHDALFQPQLALQESMGQQLMLHDQVYQPQLQQQMQQAPLGNHGMLISGGAIPNVGGNSVAGNASFGDGAVNMPLYTPYSGQEGNWGFGSG